MRSAASTAIVVIAGSPAWAQLAPALPPWYKLSLNAAIPHDRDR
jgi:hypothetical protein